MIEFYISCPVGFENDLVAEMKSFWFEMIDLDGLPTRMDFPEVETSVGGVEFRTEEHLGYQINFFTKIANRVLVRIAQFDCRYYDQIEKEIPKTKLEQWIPKTRPLFLKTESHKSRLNNEKNILEAATKSFKKMGYNVVDSDEKAQIVFLRFEKDRAKISLDTSGEHLHRRGYAVYRGEAPIRENLAALVIQQLYRLTDSKLNLVDPFSGSGTMLFEAASFYEPHFNREYSWLHFLKAPKLFKSDSWKKNYRWLNLEKQIEFCGLDIDEKSISNAKQNKKLFENMYPHLKLKLHLHHEDSLKVDFKKLETGASYWIATNPPYGHRLSDEGAVAILQRFEADPRLQGIAVIHPDSWNFNFKRLKLVSKLDFKNQGLKLKLSLYSR